MMNTNIQLTKSQQVLILPKRQNFNTESLKSVSLATIKWILIASEFGINVDKQQRKIAEVIKQSPSITAPRNNFELEVTILQLIIMQSMYCNQIIRKVMKAVTEQEFEKLNAKTSNKEFIKIYKEKVLEYIPPKICLIKISLIENVFQEVMTFFILMNEHMKKNHKPMNFCNVSKRCGQ